MSHKVNIVPHTHWDREWYLPFQTYRTKLVNLIDSLLDFLESNGSFKTFMLDGQMAVLDDYLEIRPENRTRLINLSKQDRLAMGPWYILMDEFLVSGETILRNLQLGINKAAEYSGHMPLGYLPDMFGHIAQMPQILKLANMDTAVVWRGVPSQIKHHQFIWQALDKSEVIAEFLMSGYGNGATLPNDPQALINRVRGYMEHLAQFVKGDPLLYMNGSDHLFFQRFLPDVIEAANQVQDDYDFEITDLKSSIVKPSTSLRQNLSIHQGELRSSAYSNLLMGVTSNRTDIRLLARQAEMLTEQFLEPLYAIFSDSWPTEYLKIIWKLLIQNSAHDSICACSINEVVEIVKTRYLEVRQICNALLDELYTNLTTQVEDDCDYVLNPSAKTIDSIVEFEIDNHDEILGTQVLLKSGTGFEAPLIKLKSSEVAIILTQLNSNQIDDKTFVVGVDISAQEGLTKVRVHIDSAPNPKFSVDTAHLSLKNVLDEQPDNMVEVSLSSSPKQRLLAIAKEQSGLSLEPLKIQTDFIEISLTQSDSTIQLGNKFLTAIIDRSDGTFSINGIQGFNKIVDSGDQGDTYNYSPPEFDTEVETPASTSVQVTEQGPIRAIVTIDRTYLIPEAVSDASRQREGQTELRILTLVELNANENFMRVSHFMDNFAKDHRLRTVFPVANGTATSEADTAFGVVKRGLVSESGPSEVGLPTFPALSFVKAGNITVIMNCVGEYELIDIKDDKAFSLAITLLRAVKYLSRITMTNRPLSAGPNLETTDAQMQGKQYFSYAVSTDDNINVYEAKAKYTMPFKVLKGNGSSNKDNKFPKLKVQNCEISSVVRSQGKLEVRLFNPTDSTTKAVIEESSGVVVDLLGNPIEPFNGSVDLRAFGIVTIRLD